MYSALREFCKSEYVKREKSCFMRYPNTEKKVEKTRGLKLTTFYGKLEYISKPQSHPVVTFFVLS